MTATVREYFPGVRQHNREGLGALGGTGVAQLGKGPTLDFHSGHLMVCGFEPHVGLCAGSAKPAWNALSLSLPLPCVLSL